MVEREIGKKWPFYMNGVCVCVDYGHRIFGVVINGLEGGFGVNTKCVCYKVLIQINGKWGRLISRIFMTSTFADVKIQSRFFVVLMF